MNGEPSMSSADGTAEDWEMDDYIPLVEQSTPNFCHTGVGVNLEETEPNDTDWENSNYLLQVDTKAVDKAPSAPLKDSEILILVDLTVLSLGKIHNKFDKFSVNDNDAKVKLCEKIASNYDEYFHNSKLIMEQTVRHCSDTVWRDALQSLRNDHKGHYWFPFFPPKSHVKTNS